MSSQPGTASPWIRGLAVIAVVLFASCATAPEDPDARAAFEAANDPLEPVNRAIFAMNLALDRTILRPLAEVYRGAVPDFGRDAVRNFLDNLESPVILANDILQGDADRAGVTATRFVMNSTLGIAGLFDPATEAGLPRHDEDFGQTLGVWGFAEGPYLMLPLLGPSSLRDAGSLAGDYFLDPLPYLLDNADLEYFSYVRYGLRVIDTRSRNIETLDEIERTSIDFYATIRSLYRQRRMDEIRNGEPAEMPLIPQITFEDENGVDELTSTAE